MNKTVVIKPHHFLDIIKLYGKGIEEFVPDKKYNHDFYRIGNVVLGDKETLLILILGSDDVCKPCKYLKKGKCTDKIEGHGNYTSKEEFNRLIDTRILKQLGLRDGQKITALEFCLIAKDKLDVFEIWKEERHKIKANREKNLFMGLDKYIGNEKS
jgi:hypothetical protein